MNILVLTLHLAAATPAGAADSFLQNSSWASWLGCWQAEGAPANEIVCISREAAGIRIATLIDGALRDESRIIADGLARPVQGVGCNGTERAQWSGDGRRVFLDSDVACGNAARRNVRGMFAFVAPDEWISVQTAAEGDSVATRVVRFVAVDRARLPAAAAAFASRTTVAEAALAVDESDVNEAVERIGAPAVQEWMRLAGEPFQLGYANQDRGMSSALEQVGRLSNPVVVREVVTVVERPVYVHNTYYTDRYRWHYSPWGHHYHGWHWSHRPRVVVHFPLIIHRNSHYHRDYWRRDRYDNWRDRDDDRDDDWRGGRATRDGYSSGRDRNTPDRTTPSRAVPDRVVPGRTEPQRSTPPPAIRQATTRQPRASATAPRTGSSTSRATTSRGTTSRGTTSRTAKARGSSSN